MPAETEKRTVTGVDERTACGALVSFAAPADGDTASSHLAGVTVDLQRRGMSKDQIRWMEHYLFYMKAIGLVEPEEERHQWVFHIMVSDRYAEWRLTQDLVPMEQPDAPVTALSLNK